MKNWKLLTLKQPNKTTTTKQKVLPKNKQTNMMEQRKKKNQNPKFICQKM